MNESISLLIVEDEVNLGETLVEYLKGAGFKAFWAQNLAEARIVIKEQHPQLTILDIGLPDGSGLDLAQEIRRNDKSTIIFFLSALNDPEIRVQGLELGAEDYITKPFALKELILRIQRVIKNRELLQNGPNEIVHGKLKIWFQRFEVQDAHQNMIALSQKENAILNLLYERNGNVVSREEIIEKIWGEDKFPSNRTVDNYIVKLRRWCESDKNHPLEIQSIRSTGYKLVINQ